MGFETPEGGPPPKIEKAPEDEIVQELKGAAEQAGQAPTGPVRRLHEFERVLPLHYLPTPEKEFEMKAEGYEASAAFFWTGADGNTRPVVLNDGLRDAIKTRLRQIREKMKNDPVEKDAAIGILDAAVRKFVALKRPDDAAEIMSSVSSEWRFFIHSKKPTLRPRTAVSAEQTDAVVSDIEQLPQIKDIDPLELARAFGLDAGSPIVVVGEQVPAEPDAEEEEEEEGSKAASGTGRPIPPLRQLAFDMHRAHGSGKWTPELDMRYLELMDGLPQFYQHRMAYLDLLARVKRGEMKMPERMISVASGPLEETLAQADLKALADQYGLKAPLNVNVDLGIPMLKGGAEKFEKRHGQPPRSAQARSFAQMLPFKDEAFDLAECSSLDSLASAEDVYATLSEMVRVTRLGGHLRIVFRYRLSEAFFKSMEDDFGLTFVTAPHTAFSVDAERYAALKGLVGEKLADGFRRKLGNEEYIIARRDRLPKGMIGDVERAAAFKKAETEAGPDDQALQDGLFGALHELARGRTDIRAYAITKIQQENLTLSPSAAAEMEAGEFRPDVLPQPPVVGLLRQQKPENFPAELPAREAAKGPTAIDLLRAQKESALNRCGSERPQDVTFRIRLAGLLKEDLRREHRLNPNPTETALERKEAERLKNLERMKGMLAARADVYGAMRLLSREEKIDILWQIAPRVARELEAEGAI